jgi:5-formyltetrahydrofolate cyclo-ligase
MRTVRTSIPPPARADMARAAEERLLSVPAVNAARTLLVFWSFGPEIDTQGVIERLRSEGRRVLLPFIEGGRMEAALFRADDDLVPTGYGPMAPAGPAAVDPAGIDVALAPGLAFDARGYRLGYGGGHFDRFLPRLRPDALRVGYCFHLQIVDRVPNGPEDEPVDLVITDRETFTCGGR